MPYHHRQPAPFMVGTFSVAALFAGLSLLAMYLSHHLPPLPVVLVIAVAASALGMSAIMFGSMTVTIQQDRLELFFGAGWFKREFLLADIAGVQAVQIPWYYGWGIHFVGSGWVYNVAGSRAVELRTKNNRKHFVGTDEAETLAAAIRTQLPHLQ